MRILVACEESQAVTVEMRRLGHEAYSCDIQSCSGGHPEWHILGDALPLINGHCTFSDAAGGEHRIDSRWDLLIAHPPCTYLTNACTRSFSLRCTPAEKVVRRWELRCKAIIFFLAFAGADCERICIENPLGFMSNWRKPDQIIHPWQFSAGPNDMANYVTKRTCLWLKGLPRLAGSCEQKPTPVYRVRENGTRKVTCWEEHCRGRDRSKRRSRTFPGIARAMAEQWAGDARKEAAPCDTTTKPAS